MQVFDFECLLLIFISFDSKFALFVIPSTSSVGASGLIPKRKHRRDTTQFVPCLGSCHSFYRLHKRLKLNSTKFRVFVCHGHIHDLDE